MKLVITGASGLVGTELIRQSLKHPGISSVIAVARKSLSAPADLDATSEASKFRSVKIDDYGVYSDEVKEQLSGVDACIWTVAITPMTAKGYSDEELRKINHEHALTGMKVIFEASKSRTSNTAFRFIYMSGIAAERDQTKKPSFMPRYSLLRGETESAVIQYAAQQNGQMDATAAKPGPIIQQGRIGEFIWAGALKLFMGVPNIYLTEISAAMLDQIVNGFEKDPLMNDDLVRIGKGALAKQQ